VGLESGQFESKVQQINDKIGKISTELSNTSKSGEERINSFEQTVKVIKGNVDRFYDQYGLVEGKSAFLRSHLFLRIQLLIG
jgi:hypothetical protein